MAQKTLRYLLPALCAALLAACAPVDRDVIYQTSTIDALLDGVYDGDVAYADVMRRGDFGIGTFDGLDGEMVAVDGEVYQVKWTGEVERKSLAAKTPFATVTFFEADEDARLEGNPPVKNLEALTGSIDALLPAKNMFYAIRITGHFDYVKTRSVPPQTKPYPPLVEVAKHQPVFEFRNIEGELIGFRCPEFVKGVNVPGYHLHFLSSDRRAGGHLLDCVPSGALDIEIDPTKRYFLRLPDGGDFYKTDLTADRGDELHKVEK